MVSLVILGYLKQIFMRYFLWVSYMGNGYHGWQKQPMGGTVQDVLEAAFALVGQRVTLVGSGRTDAGVHAVQQVAHFDVAGAIDCEKILYQVNAVLPATVVLRAIVPVDGNLHARYAARSRRYEYHITRVRNPFKVGQSLFYPYPLDVEVMNKGAEALLGQRSFTSFCKKKSAVAHHDCVVKEAIWHKRPNGYTFSIRANRFLHTMVRTIVGTLLAVGERRLPPEAIGEIIERKDRCSAGKTLPPTGLFLMEVAYDQPIFSLA